MGYTSFSNLSLSAYNELSSVVEDRVYFINDEGTIRLNEVTYGAGGGGYDDTDYLCFIAEQANSTIALNRNRTDYLTAVLEYSTDGETWTNYEWNESTGTVITLANVGDYVKFRGDNETFSVGDLAYYTFVMTGKIAASGNIMSILDKTCKKTSMPNYGFTRLFYNCMALTSAPALPATSLAHSCYSNMFYGCRALTSAPALPATSLAQKCYSNMFSDCRALTSAPALPATSLANSCYFGMFNGCLNLSTAQITLAAFQVPQNAYNSMFASCSKLVICPKILATSFDSYWGMKSMFQGCSLLKSIEISFMNWSNVQQDWLSNVSSTGTFYCPYGLDTSIRDASHIPVGWNVVYTDVPESVLSGISATTNALTMN